ncbi:MAG: hypothetical protein KIG61_08195 [Muribaculaceae bacterium]|nr:hypothetical protein [Muribaculaceae bacterium]
MVTKAKIYIIAAISVSIIMLMASCSSDEPAMESDVANNDGWKKATLNFHPELSQTAT